jgi:predicted transposase YdaD
LPPERLLRGGIGTLPLAPISSVTEAQLPAVVDAVARRLEAEAAPHEVPDLWACTQILMGIRWPRQLIHQVLKGARQMKDSVIYQEILEEGIEKGIEKGRVTEARMLLLRRGARTLGIPEAVIHSRLDAINDVGTLEELTDRVIDGSFATWAELLASLA